MKRVITGTNLFTLFVLLIISGLAVSNTVHPAISSAPIGSKNSPLTVDGVSLGMTGPEVESLWGLVEYRSLLLFLAPSVSKPEASVGTGNFADLDAQARVSAVAGRRLRHAGRLIVDPSMEFSQVDLSLIAEPYERETQAWCGSCVIFETKWWYRPAEDTLICIATYHNNVLRDIPEEAREPLRKVVFVQILRKNEVEVTESARWIKAKYVSVIFYGSQLLRLPSALFRKYMKPVFFNHLD